MDINPFEVIGKTIRRSNETLEDGSTYIFNGAWDCSIGLGWQHGKIAKEESDTIALAARDALSRNDLDEAAHQLRRQSYFCSTVDSLAGSENERAARAGLKAISQGESPLQVLQSIVCAPADPFAYHPLASTPPNLAERFFTQFQKEYETNTVKAAEEVVDLRHQLQKQKQFHDPNYAATARLLSVFDLAIADLKLDANDTTSARALYKEATGLTGSIPFDDPYRDLPNIIDIEKRVGSKIPLQHQ